MSARLDTELLRTFAAVADSGSFTRAAGLVGRTQSAVSMQIKKLEQAAGRPLFARQARGVRLTAQGQTLLVRARQILALLDQAADALGGDPLEGLVTVGIPEEYGSTILPLMLAHFAQSQPSVEVTVRCEPSPTLEAALAAREVDLAVLVVGGGRGQGEVLVRDPTVWVTSARHRVHEQDPVPVALFDPACWWRDRALEMLEQRWRAYRVAYTSRSVAGLQAAVSSGLAIAVLARSTVPPGSRILTDQEGYATCPDRRSSFAIASARQRGWRTRFGMPSGWRRPDRFSLGKNAAAGCSGPMRSLYAVRERGAGLSGGRLVNAVAWD